MNLGTQTMSDRELEFTLMIPTMAIMRCDNDDDDEGASYEL